MNNNFSDYYPIQNDNNYIRQNQNGTIPEMYLENNLKLNIGRTVTFHMSFPDSNFERDKSFHGIIYEVARDHVVIGNQSTDKWYMLPLTYLNYAEFDEKPILFKQ